MALSPRLEAVLGLLTPCARLADIGTDHAQVPVAAVQRGLAQRAVGVDLHRAPLRFGQRTIQRAGLADRVALVLGDGLLPLAADPPDAVVIAGLTGPTVVRVCAAAPAILAQVRQLILQPDRDQPPVQSSVEPAPRVRTWARQAGWHLRAEGLVVDRGRLFATCAFTPGTGPDPAYALPGWAPETLERVGPHLVARRDPLLVAHAAQQLDYARGHWAAGRAAFEAEVVFWTAVVAQLAEAPRPLLTTAHTPLDAPGSAPDAAPP